MVRIIDLAWAAGFLEGEGTFARVGNTIRVTAGQVQKEPLLRLHQLFGGRLWLRPSEKHQPIWIWYLNTQSSAAVMMTLHSFMSPKRKTEIENALHWWKNARPIGKNGFCSRGHEVVGYNAYVPPNSKYAQCRICKQRRYKQTAVPDASYSSLSLADLGL